MSDHKNQKDVWLRLKKAHGHLNKVISMIEQQSPCTPTSQQLHAVIRALDKAKKIYIHDHIDHCITGNSDNVSDELIEDLKEIVKYL